MKNFRMRDGYVVQAYRFALAPNAAQERALRSHCGASRAAYNWAVRHVTATWKQRIAEQSYGVAHDDLTPWRSWTLPALRKTFNEIKHTDPRWSWWVENSKEAYNSGLTAAAAAFDNYSKSKSGNRAGKRLGMPRLKSKRKARLTCRFTTGTIRADADGPHVTLPRLGTIRTHEPTWKLLNADARILSATIRHERGRWFVSFSVEMKRAAAAVTRPDAVAGIDLGVKTLAIIADNSGTIAEHPNPRHLKTAQKQLRRASRMVSRRRGPDRRTGQKPSRRWKQANRARNRIHHRVANLRMDTLHKLTTAVAAEYATVVIEDLNVAGMMRNRRLAQSISDAGFGQLRRQIEYKTRWHGGETVVADRWYPSSKSCSGCGVVKAKLPLRVRTFDCERCGLSLDRDRNAALNLAALARAVTVNGSGVAGTVDASPKNRRADRKTSALLAGGVETGTAVAVETVASRDTGTDPHDRKVSEC